MRKDSRRRAPRFTLACAALSAVLAAATCAQAQRSSRIGPTARDVSRSERDLSALEREASPKRDPKAVMSEINEDFGRLRAIDEGLRQAGAASAPLDYKNIAVESAEVKKRAARLRTNLSALPKPEKEEKRPKLAVPLDDAQMKSLLASFEEQMSAFLNNPVFSDMGTLDTQLALKARRDLDGLIEMCEVVRKGADKLGQRARP